MRVDGILRAVSFSADAPPQAVVSRIKILAGLNIAERRLPQDGAAHARVGRAEIDIRIATMPTQHGESVVIRLLPRDRGLLELNNMGVVGRDESTLRRLLALPHGLVRITVSWDSCCDRPCALSLPSGWSAASATVARIGTNLPSKISSPTLVMGFWVLRPVRRSIVRSVAKAAAAPVIVGAPGFLNCW